MLLYKFTIVRYKRTTKASSGEKEYRRATSTTSTNSAVLLDCHARVAFLPLISLDCSHCKNKNKISLQNYYLPMQIREIMKLPCMICIYLKKISDYIGSWYMT